MFRLGEEERPPPGLCLLRAQGLVPHPCLFPTTSPSVPRNTCHRHPTTPTRLKVNRAELWSRKRVGPRCLCSSRVTNQPVALRARALRSPARARSLHLSPSLSGRETSL